MPDNNNYRNYTCNFELHALKLDELRISDVSRTIEKHTLAANSTTTHQLTGNQSYDIQITWSNNIGYGHIHQVALYRSGTITWIPISSNVTHALFTFNSIVYPNIDVRPQIVVTNILGFPISYTFNITGDL